MSAPGRLGRAAAAAPLRTPRGRVTAVCGDVISATLPQARVGALCRLLSAGAPPLRAEVIGLGDGRARLLSFDGVAGVSTDTEVVVDDYRQSIGVGDALLGRVVDGFGAPLDGGPAPRCETRYPLDAAPLNPLSRRPLDAPLALGVRAIDALLTCAEGARFGVFAAAGVGKSTLLASAVRDADVDVVVVALVGERGREVGEFVAGALGRSGLARAVVVAAPADRPAPERVRAATAATALAEYFRDRGRRVLLLIDSLTRYARALREIGLAAGETPTRNGFPASVFAALPRLLERAGRTPRGSITALYAILVEGDDMTEPVADEARSLLDGHIVLSRRLADAGRFPAVDVLASASRVMTAVVDTAQRDAALKTRRLLASYAEVELLLQVGEYRPGSDQLVDEAIERREAIDTLLRQPADEASVFSECRARLLAAVGTVANR